MSYMAAFGAEFLGELRALGESAVRVAVGLVVAGLKGILGWE